MSPSRTIEAVQPSGLIFKQTIEILPYHYGVVFQKRA
jgi:hypothetical protein